jgi:N-acetylneuraminate synthase
MGIRINNEIAGDDKPCYIIAEAGVNHNGDIDIAKQLIDATKTSGSNAIKFQTFNVDEGTPKNIPKVSYMKRGSSKDESMYELLKKYEFGLDEFIEIKKYCDKKKITFLSTPCDLKSLDILKFLDVDVYKIGSGDLTFIPLIREVAKTGKPVLISTGMPTLAEIEHAVTSVEKAGNNNIILLQCTTNYPLAYCDVNLNVIKTLQSAFGYPVGFSDHTPGIEVSIAAVAMGARVIEKHITLDKTMKGPDHSSSLEPYEMKLLVNSIRNVESALGSTVKKPTKTEIEIAQIVRKSIVALKPIKRGEVLDSTNVGIMKPGLGLSPKYLNEVLGKKIKHNKSAYQYIHFGDLE